MANDANYQITIKLLEDLHSGTGTGNGIVDAVQARNEAGYPVIDRHHFRGVLRDNALRLVKLGVIDNKLVASLFGESGKQQRKLDCSSLIAEKKDCLIHWESTARQQNSRCPEDNSLRRIEYIRAGTRLSGTLTIRNASGDEKTALNTILKFTTRLGAERTRGSGQFTLKCEPEQSKSPAFFLAIDNQTQKIRLLLRNTEPLNIPTRGYAGNTIHSESHIPGRTLFAALCQRAHQQGGDAGLKALFADNENKITVHNAYPLPEDYKKQALDKLLSIPMPHAIHAVKQPAAEEEQALHWPHWATQETDNTPELDDIKDINLLHANTNNKTQRPKGEMYLIRDEQGKWRRYVQPMSIRMRNMRGDPFGKLTRKDTELFSEQRIPANTHFLLDIECQDNDLLKTIIGYLQQPVFIGRSKAPVEVVAAVAINHDTKNDCDNNSAFTLIATSDWILRGENLGYLTQLDKDSLGQTLDIEIKALKASYQESEQQGSFNYASGLPYRPFYVIKRGSSFKVSLAPDTQLDGLKHPIGERTREGYGQYVIDLPIKLQEKAREKEAEYQQQIKAQEEAEQAAKAAQKQRLMEPVKTIIDNANGKFPNERQWNELIDRFKQMPATIDNQLKLSQFARGLLGKPCFTSLGGLNLARALYEVSQEESHLANPDTVVLFLELLKEEAQS